MYLVSSDKDDRDVLITSAEALMQAKYFVVVVEIADGRFFVGYSDEIEDSIKLLQRAQDTQEAAQGPQV